MRAILGALILCSLALTEAGAIETYLGGSVGQVTLEDEFNGEDFKEKDMAFRAFIGFRTGLLPVLDFALEAGYRDLGDTSGTAGGESIEVKLSGYDVAGLVILPFGPVDFYVKAGVMGYNLDTSVAGVDSEEISSDFLYGAGIGARFWKIGVRAEYEIVNVDELDNASMYWLSGYFRF